jgi:hypothetical protein
MGRMVRKQFFIEEEQAALLKRIARERGVSESAVVRECLRDLARRAQQPEVQVQPDPEAWKRADAFIRKLIAMGPVPGGRTWRREDLYEE